MPEFKMPFIRANMQNVFYAMIIVALLAGCGTPGKNLPVTEVTAKMGIDRFQEISVEVESFYFKPNRLKVIVNVPVRITLKSGASIIPHNFSIHAPEAGIDIDQNIGHGKTEIVEFTPTKTGEYSFFCAKDGHAHKGMVGTLVVLSQ
jgi:plastocyanin domain-containing protein